MRLQTIAALVALALTVGCASGGARTMAAAAAAAAPPPATAQDTSGIGPQYPSTYKRHPNPPVLIRSAVLKLVPARSVQEMKFPGAHYGLKMACGENPKRVYGNRGGPSTRMGNMAGYRDAFIQAQAYRRKWDKWNKDHQGDPPERN